MYLKIGFCNILLCGRPITSSMGFNIRIRVTLGCLNVEKESLVSNMTIQIRQEKHHKHVISLHMSEVNYPSAWYAEHIK